MIRPFPFSKTYKPIAITRDQSTSSTRLIQIFIFLGILIRLFHLFDNRSLWNDEMYLASSLVQMNLVELATSPLHYEQKAPLGFLWAVKLCIMVFGKSEMALRLFPLVSGITALIIFRTVARQFLGPMAAVVAMGIMAFSPFIIYHAVEIKQYSTELLATVFLLWLYGRYSHQSNQRSLLIYGLLGAVTVWFSFSSIFILVGIAGGTCIYLAYKKKWSVLWASFIPFALWAISFGINYILFVKNHPAKEWLIEWFSLSHGFMPLPPKSFSDMGWFVHKLFGIFHYPLGLSWLSLPPEQHPLIRLLARMSVVPLLLLGLGLGAYLRSPKKHLLIFVLPICLHLLASGVQAFPFMERLTFYLAPLFILFLARGVQSIAEYFPNKKIITYVVVALILFGPLFNTARQLINPALFGDFKKSYDREALLFIDQNFKPGDVVYVYWNNLVPYRYYQDNYNLQFKVVEGTDHKFTVPDMDAYLQKLEQEIQALKGYNRVWIIYNKILPNGNIGDRMYDPEWYFKSGINVPVVKVHPLFASYGKQVQKLETRNVNVALFQWGR